MLHTSAWYFADERLGPVAPCCSESPEGRDGTHCNEVYGYGRDTGGLPNLLGKSHGCFLFFYEVFVELQIDRATGHSNPPADIPTVGWYRDTLNGAIDGGLGLGSKAWALGSRREAYLGLAPGSSIPTNVVRRSALSGSEVTSSENAGMDTQIWGLAKP